MNNLLFRTYEKALKYFLKTIIKKSHIKKHQQYITLLYKLRNLNFKKMPKMGRMVELVVSCVTHFANLEVMTLWVADNFSYKIL